METSVIDLVKAARDEVLEEAEAWLEGANGNDSKVVIQKILDNLIQSLEEGTVSEDIHEETSFSKFEMGEEVTFIASYSAGDPRLSRALGYDKTKEKFGFLYRGEKPKKGVIIEKAPNPIVPDEGDVYLIESEGEKFVCHEDFLKKEEEKGMIKEKYPHLGFSFEEKTYEQTSLGKKVVQRISKE